MVHTQVWNMNSSVWAVWAAQGSKGKKVDLRFSEQLLRVFFQLFVGKKLFLKKFISVVESTLKSYIA
jgi:hypothetical protein